MRPPQLFTSTILHSNPHEGWNRSSKISPGYTIVPADLEAIAAESYTDDGAVEALSEKPSLDCLSIDLGAAPSHELCAKAWEVQNGDGSVSRVRRLLLVLMILLMSLCLVVVQVQVMDS